MGVGSGVGVGATATTVGVEIGSMFDDVAVFNIPGMRNRPMMRAAVIKSTNSAAPTAIPITKFPLFSDI